MDINKFGQPLLNDTLLRPIKSTTSTAVKWQPGQIVTATVVSQATQPLTLKIDDEILLSNSALNFRPGDQLLLQAEKQEGQWVLKFLQLLNNNSIIRQHLAQLLPKQQSYNILLANLHSLQQQFTATHSLPNTLRTLISETLATVLPQHEIISAAGVKKALLQSGLFLENHLQKTAQQPLLRPLVTKDFKGHLLRLAHYLEKEIETANKQEQRPTQPQAATTSPTKTSRNDTHKQAHALQSQAAAEPINKPSQKIAYEKPVHNNTVKPSSDHQPNSATPKNNPAAATHTPSNTPHDKNSTTAAKSSTITAAVNTQTNEQTVTKKHSLLASATTAHSAQQPLHADVRLIPPLRTHTVVPQANAHASLAATTQTQSLYSELLQQLKASIARISLSQTASLPNQEGQALNQQVDIPIAHHGRLDIMPIKIEQDKGSGRSADNNRAQQNKWLITLAFHLQPLGALQVKLALTGNEISTYFWSEQCSTLESITNNKEILQQQLQAHGITTLNSSCHLGTLTAANKTPPEDLIDIQV